MKKEIRLPQKSDQKNIDKAAHLIGELMELNPHIEPTLWCAALISSLVVGYRNCDYSYKEFRNEMSIAFDHYEGWWNE